MLRHIDHQTMGRSQLGWLDSHFHFSFAEYRNAANIRFGALRVVNDDIIQPGTGFDTHPHENMEIITYVVDGELTHADSMGNRHTLTRGQVQYMSAGTGITHSEHNMGEKVLRLLQIWIFPDQKGYVPSYGDFRFQLEDRREVWLPLAAAVGNIDSQAPVRLHQDINMYAAILPAGKALSFVVAKKRQAYLVQIEGQAVVGDVAMQPRDALEIVEEDIVIKALSQSHVLVIEMAKG